MLPSITSGMFLAFDFTSGYAAVIYVLGGLLVVVAVVEKVYRWSRWLRSKGRRELEPPQPPPPLPAVVLGHPSAGISKTPLHELREGETSKLTRVAPTFLIENKGATPIREVDAGVRTREGMEQRFHEFHAPLIAGGEKVPVTGEIPTEWLDNVHESVAQDAFRYWARFNTEDGHVWEAIYDAEHRLHEYAFHGRVPSD